MIGVLATVLGLVAVGAWCLAVVTAFQIVRLAPAGQRLSSWFKLGWWQFDKIRAVAGPQVQPLLKRYVGAFLAFFLCVIGGMGLGLLLAIEQEDEVENAVAERTPLADNLFTLRTADRAAPSFSSGVES